MMYIEKLKYVFFSAFLILLPNNYTRGEIGYGVSNIFTLNTRITVGVEEENKTPKSFYIYQNYPNPFNPETTIKFQIPKSTFVTLKIYNISGKEIKSLVNETKSVDFYSVKWDGTNNNGLRVNSGVYIYRIKAGSFTDVKKMVFLK